MIGLYKVAANLRLRGLNKLAQNVLDFAKKRREQDLIKEKNKRILDEMKNEDKMKSIFDQHQQDKPDLQPELSYPTGNSSGKRYEVNVSYPSFDEKGAAYFDNDSVNEYLTMTEDELLSHQEQEKQGYIKINDVKPLLPKSSKR